MDPQKSTIAGPTRKTQDFGPPAKSQRYDELRRSIPKVFEGVVRSRRGRGGSPVVSAKKTLIETPLTYRIFGGADVTKPNKLIWFGDIHGPKPYHVIEFR